MWGYNYNYLSHANYKYLDKYKSKSGKWVYIYEKSQNMKKGQAARDRNIGSQLDSRMKSYNDTSNRRASVEQESVKRYQYKKRLEAARKAAQEDSSSKNKVKDLIDNRMKSTLDPNRRSAQSSREAAIQESARKIQEKNRQDQLAKAANQAEREHSSKSAAIDSRRDREKEISKVVQSIRQQNAAKQAEAERKAAGYDTRERQKAAAKQTEKERRMASNTAERAQNARQKGMNESVKKTWKVKANNEIKNKAQFDRKQDELVQLCKNLNAQYFAEDGGKIIKNWKKVDAQREVAFRNWATKIKNTASLLAASDVSAMNSETYAELQNALTIIRAHQEAYNQGGIESKNNNSTRNQLYYTKNQNEDLVRDIEKVLEEVKTWEDVDRETTENDRKRIKTWEDVDRETTENDRKRIKTW